MARAAASTAGRIGALVAWTPGKRKPRQLAGLLAMGLGQISRSLWLAVSPTASL